MIKKENYKSETPCVPCGFYQEDMNCYHHIQTRGSGGGDEDFNLISVCLKCHNDFHSKGTVFMAVKYPSVMEWLKKNNWYFCKLTNKWRHTND